jgi:hypothetical protein
VRQGGPRDPFSSSHLISSSNGGQICLSPKRLHLFPGTAKAAAFNQPRRKKYRSCRVVAAESPPTYNDPCDLRTAINKSYMPDLTCTKDPSRVSRCMAVANMHFPMPRPPLAACPKHNNAGQSNSMPSACSCRVVCESASVNLALALWVSLLVTQGYASDLASLFCCCHLTRLRYVYSWPGSLLLALTFVLVLACCVTRLLIPYCLINLSPFAHLIKYSQDYRCFERRSPHRYAPVSRNII